MLKTTKKKIGPKSKTPRRNTRNRGTLGETSGESENETSNSIPTTHETRFLTPEREDDATDYGLEFSTSRLRITPQRSTMRNASTSATGVRNSLGDEPPQTHQKQVSKSNPRRAIASTSKQAQKTLSSSRRKQRNPVQLEKRFWKEVQKLQNRAYLIPLLPFSRLVRELIHKNTTEVSKITPTALEALQTASEMYLTQRLQDAYMLTLHRNRLTLAVKDLQLMNFFKPNIF